MDSNSLEGMISIANLSYRGVMPKSDNQEDRQKAGHGEIKACPDVPLPSSTSKFPLDSGINFD
jgi:hypothetical protein